MDTDGKVGRIDADPNAPDRPLQVRHRLLIAETERGSVACFPPPHQFFFPRDLTDNLRTVWYGKDHRNLEDRFGFGIRQSETGGGSFVPWFNAPPGTEQRLGVFYLLSKGRAEDALKEVLRYTHGDRFPDLPGHHKLTSHWHMAITMAAMKEMAKGGARTTPDLVGMFKDMNVNIVHLAEFHGDGHPFDPGPLGFPRCGDVRRVPAPLGRVAVVFPRRRGQRRPWPLPTPASIPATGCASSPGPSTGP